MTEKFAAAVVPVAGSLKDVLLSLDRSGFEIALITDETGRMLGIMTDGDVRRALLHGADLADPLAPHVKRNFIAVEPGVGRAEVLDIMKARTLGQIPIVDAEGRLLGLHLLREIIGSAERSNWVVVMAGGRGERLKPLTDSVPKPMVPVAGRPILERMVLHLIGQGFRKIFLSVNYLSEVIESHFGDGSSYGCEINYLREREPLGTGGALSLLPEGPEAPILVLNGDLLTQFNAAGMLLSHEREGNKATVGCYEYAHTIPYGVLLLDDKKVTGIREKPREAWTVNAGIYVLAPDLVGRVPEGKYFTLPALVAQCLEQGEPVGAYRIEEEWMDIGRKQDLQRARGDEGDR